jgi:hypothetical protein
VGDSPTPRTCTASLPGSLVAVTRKKAVVGVINPRTCGLACLPGSQRFLDLIREGLRGRGSQTFSGSYKRRITWLR